MTSTSWLLWHTCPLFLDLCCTWFPLNILKKSIYSYLNRTLQGPWLQGKPALQSHNTESKQQKGSAGLLRLWEGFRGFRMRLQGLVVKRESDSQHNTLFLKSSPLNCFTLLTSLSLWLLLSIFLNSTLVIAPDLECILHVLFMYLCFLCFFAPGSKPFLSYYFSFFLLATEHPCGNSTHRSLGLFTAWSTQTQPVPRPNRPYGEHCAQRGNCS